LAMAGGEKRGTGPGKGSAKRQGIIGQLQAKALARAFRVANLAEPNRKAARR